MQLPIPTSSCNSETKVESTLAARDAIRNQINQTENAVISAERKLDGFIRDNVERIVAATGQSELAQLYDEVIALESGNGRGSSAADEQATALTGGISASVRTGPLLRPGDDVLGSVNSVAGVVKGAYEGAEALGQPPEQLVPDRAGKKSERSAPRTQRGGAQRQIAPGHGG